MTGPLAASGAAQPEKLVAGLRHRLTAHAAWEAVLFFLPPLLAVCYIAFFLHRFAWLGADAVVAPGAALLCVAVLLAAWRFRSLIPSQRFVARLIDDKSDGEDRFVTLATIDPASCSPVLLSRLRLEAASLLPRVELKRDFPFRVRRSFLNSCIGSLVVILLFHLLMELAPVFAPKTLGGEELALLSQQLSRTPGLEQLAGSLKTLLAQLQEPALSKEEKRSLIEELLNRIKEQLAGAQQGAGSGEKLLRQAADQLSGLEKGLEQGQGKGAGGGQERPPQGRGGAGNKTGEGSEAEQQGGLTVPIPSLKMQNLPTPELTTPGGKELKGQGEGGQRGERKDAQGSDRGSDLERATKPGTESKGTRGQREKVPTGPTPERFLRPGERGAAGLKGSRFVTVELPEEEIQGRAGTAASRKGRRSLGAKLPAGNIPLRQPDVPDAVPEKQQLPLEYRGLLR